MEKAALERFLGVRSSLQKRTFEPRASNKMLSQLTEVRAWWGRAPNIPYLLEMRDRVGRGVILALGEGQGWTGSESVHVDFLHVNLADLFHSHLSAIHSSYFIETSILLFDINIHKVTFHPTSSMVLFTKLQHLLDLNVLFCPSTVGFSLAAVLPSCCVAEQMWSGGKGDAPGAGSLQCFIEDICRDLASWRPFWDNLCTW